MPTFEINKDAHRSETYRATVEAATYRQEGDYFVFYSDASRTKKVLTVAATAITTVDTVSKKP